MEGGGFPMEVGIWNIPRLYFQHKEGSLQRVGPWNIPDPDFGSWNLEYSTALLPTQRRFLAEGQTVEYSRSRLPLGALKGVPMEVGIWNIPRLYFRHKEDSLQRVGPWNLPDPHVHWEP